VKQRTQLSSPMAALLHPDPGVGPEPRVPSSEPRAPIRIKVCGITRREDALLAVELGASALGFVFWPRSPRAVSAATVREITDAVPAFVGRVGVFVNESPASALATAVEAGLTGIQLHGDENASEYLDSPLDVIKALPVSEGFSLAAVQDLPLRVTVLLDAHDPVHRGGTGRVIEWTVAAAAARVRPIILSGGLTPDNVTRAAAEVSPYAVDVSSGVESAPGIKDESKLRAFFAALGH
jgi:phosphoribosylanthranilate isomerase